MAGVDSDRAGFVPYPVGSNPDAGQDNFSFFKNYLY